MKKSTPHARGSTCDVDFVVVYAMVYPACAGIHLFLTRGYMFQHRLPRMRGDPPDGDTTRLENLMSTPHARGSTFLGNQVTPEQYVYPACAGIHLRQWFLDLFDKGLPRMRGDPPHLVYGFSWDVESTPHARGST